MTAHRINARPSPHSPAGPPQRRSAINPVTLSAGLLAVALIVVLLLYSAGPGRETLRSVMGGSLDSQHDAAMEAVLAQSPMRQRRQDLTVRTRRYAGDEVLASFFIRTGTAEKVACVTFEGGDMHAPEPYLVTVDFESLGRMIPASEAFPFADYWKLHKVCSAHSNLATSVN